MSPPAFDPRHLDVAAFAAAGTRLSGDWPLQGMPRLLVDATAAADACVHWSAQGETRQRAGAPGQVWLQLQASAELSVRCQRCLQPMAQPLRVSQHLRFVAGEDEASRLDEDSDEDVLAWNAALDLHELVEDEMIMALPFCPRHEHCEAPLLAPDPDNQQSTHPFAALAALRRSGDGV